MASHEVCFWAFTNLDTGHRHKECMGIYHQQALQLAMEQTRAAWWQAQAALVQAVISGGAIWAGIVFASRQSDDTPVASPA